MSELLLGCGSNRDKKLSAQGRASWSDLVTLDMNAGHNPDVVHDLNVLPLPFADETFEEIHAYEVMEHIGQQGDWRTFFAQFSEIYRLLKPGGIFFATSPHWSSPWAWMDPGHVRAMGPEMLVYLVQPQYDAQVGITPMTDYRFVFKGDFDIIHSAVHPNGQFEFALQAVKPSRCTR